MGDMADDAYIQAEVEYAQMESLKERAEQEAEKILFDYAFGDLEWRTRDGDAIYVDDMSTSHIRNSLSILFGKENPRAEAWVRVLSQELRMRLKQAQ